MNDETEIITKPPVAATEVPTGEVTTTSTTTSTPTPPNTEESKIFNVSLRGWLTLFVVGTCCYMSVTMIKIEEPFYTLVGMVVAYYFGQNAKIHKP